MPPPPPLAGFCLLLGALPLAAAVIATDGGGGGDVLPPPPPPHRIRRPDEGGGGGRILLAHHVHEINGNDSNATEEARAPLFPADLFTLEQRKKGAVALHIIGVVYMFVALAIVCDEFFVPSLDVIIEKLQLQDDVAGATFMAAGGSAPELFTSVIGVFVSFDDVGIGTIVGSAVFNILFVIGMCALFSRSVLSLTWWPLFRDCSFYSVSLLTLILCFRDNHIYWYEALVLFCLYLAYVSFMKFNRPVERCVKRHLYKNKVTRVRSTDQLMPSHGTAGTTSSQTSVGGGSGTGGSVVTAAGAGGAAGVGIHAPARPVPSSSCSSSSAAVGNAGGAGSSSSAHHSGKFRHGLLQLMIHTIDPLHDGKVDEKATQLHAIASLKVLLDATKPPANGATAASSNAPGAPNHIPSAIAPPTDLAAVGRGGGNQETQLVAGGRGAVVGRGGLPMEQPNGVAGSMEGGGGVDPEAGDVDGDVDGQEEDEPEALDMSWPDSTRKRVTYVLVAPIVFPLWLTLPDTRTPRGKKFFPVTFIGSIVWIAAYSYLMVWWADVAGDSVSIPPEVMGLTFLAAGTSIPDLITSVIVARKGFGDMAVSSSVGSNIFDVTVGLPVPWLLYGIIYGQPVAVNSVGMVCSIVILFMMLLFVILSIACFRWKMNKGLGFTMFLLYFVFVAVSLMFEYEVITCPV